LLVTLSLIASGQLIGQSLPVYQVPKGAITTAIVPLADQYRYPAFREANVTYRTGTLPGVKLNYNYLYGEMQFIDERGDTLALANEENIRYITLGEEVFYHLPGSGFVEVVADLPVAGLARQAGLQIMDRADLYQNTGFHASAGTASGPGSGTYLGSAPSYRQLFTQPAPQDLKIYRQEHFLIIDRNKRFYPTRKMTLLQLFPRHKRGINEYWKAYQPNLRKESDLIALLEFCNRLNKQ
jgi:hypothetical protein